MEFYRVWRILVSNKWVLIWLPLIATIVGLGLTYVLPEQYESTAVVIDRPFEEIKFNSDAGDQRGSLGFPVTLSAPIDSLSKTYIEVIKSPAVAVKIVDDLQLYISKPKIYENLFEEIKDKAKTWFRDTIRTLRNYAKYGRDIPASPFDLAVEDIKDKLIVSAKKDTFVFEITYRSGDPAQAAAVANKAADIFLEQRSDTYRKEATRASKFIEGRVEESREALEQARAAMLAFKSSGETFDPNSEYREKLNNLSDLESTLAKAEGRLAGLKRVSPGTNLLEQEAEIAELKNQISSLRGQLTAYPEREAQMKALALNERLAEQSYEFFLKRYEEARVKEAANVSEIRIVSRAMPGLYPVKPLKYLYAGLSFATAMVVAIGWVMFLESINPRVRTRRDLDEEPGVTVLGALPTLRHSRGTVGT
jgi:polysaccharide biosynthesis transport protein